MNSAVITKEGTYYARKVSQTEARETFQKLKGNGWQSYIGYQETASYVSKVLGIEVPVSRAETTINNGDIMIVCKLKYRISNPSEKGKFSPSEEDFEWLIIEYQA